LGVRGKEKSANESALHFISAKMRAVARKSQNKVRETQRGEGIRKGKSRRQKKIEEEYKK